MRPQSIMTEEAYGQSSIGKVRKTNQDAILLDPARHIYLLADGMGGHRGGEVASAMAVNHIYEHLLNITSTSDVHMELDQAFKKASNTIKTKADAQNELKGMGTTAIGCVLHQNRLHMAHVGDSRIYLFSKKSNSLFQLTRDHTLLVETDLPETSEKGKKYKHVLTRSVGFTDPLMVDHLFYTPKTGDLILICSDGLHGMLDFEAIEKKLQKSAPPKAITEDLISATYDRGAHDNVSIIMIKLSMSTQK
jgi:PPM family protein phosphatase